MHDMRTPKFKILASQKNFSFIRKIKKLIKIINTDLKLFADQSETYISNSFVFCGTIFTAMLASLVFLVAVLLSGSNNLWSSFIGHLFAMWFIATLLSVALWQINFVARIATLLPIKIAITALLFATVMYAKLCTSQIL